MKTREYARLRNAVVARNRHTTARAIASPLRFDGFSKSGTTPSGGGNPGLFQIFSCTSGGRFGKSYIRLAILIKSRARRQTPVGVYREGLIGKCKVKEVNCDHKGVIEKKGEQMNTHGP